MFAAYALLHVVAGVSTLFFSAAWGLGTMMFFIGCVALACDNIILYKWGDGSTVMGVYRLAARSVGVGVMYYPVTDLAQRGGLISADAVEGTTNGVLLLVFLQIAYCLGTYSPPKSHKVPPPLHNTAVPVLLLHVYQLLFAVYSSSSYPLQSGVLSLASFTSILQMLKNDNAIDAHAVLKGKLDTGDHGVDQFLLGMEAVEAACVAWVYYGTRG